MPIAIDEEACQFTLDDLLAATPVPELSAPVAQVIADDDPDVPLLWSGWIIRVRQTSFGLATYRVCCAHGRTETECRAAMDRIGPRAGEVRRVVINSKSEG